MDKQEHEEILYRLDERTKRVDDYLNRLDERVAENSKELDYHNERINENEVFIDQAWRFTKTAGAAIAAGVSGAVAAIVSYLHP